MLKDNHIGGGPRRSQPNSALSADEKPGFRQGRRASPVSNPQEQCVTGLRSNGGYLRWRILLRIFRFFRPILRRPLPVFLTPISPALPSSVFPYEKPRDTFASGGGRIAIPAGSSKDRRAPSRSRGDFPSEALSPQQITLCTSSRGCSILRQIQTVDLKAEFRDG